MQEEFAQSQEAQASFAARHQSFIAAFEAVLKNLLLPEVLPLELARPQRLLDAMTYAMLGGGKRLRPFLLKTTAEVFGVGAFDTKQLSMNALYAGAALEMVHGYSLIHDDLPAMDDDDLRRGKPTVHKAFDEATAILAGDSLLTLAFDVLSRDAVHSDAQIRLMLVRELARASGLGGMAGGQMLDLEAEKASAPLDSAAIIKLQAMKTGALLTFAVVAGGILAGCEAGVITHLRKFGRHLGCAFQIRDDVLDAQSSSAALGKAVGKDSARNKATFVATLGLEGAQSRMIAEIDAAQGSLRAAGDLCLGTHISPLLDICDFMIRRAH